MGGNISGPTPPYRYWLPWVPVFVLSALMFAIWTPPFMYPDEPTHLSSCMERMNPVARELLEKRILSSMTDHHFWERAGVEMPHAHPEKFYQAPLLRIVPTQFSKPMVYYRIGGGILKLFTVNDILPALFVLRGLSVLLSVLTAFLFGLMVAEVFPGSRWQALAMSFMAVPQYAYMAGALNATIMAWISGNMMLLSGLWLVRPERRYLGWGMALAACIIASATHQSALPLISVCLAGIILGRCRIQHHRVPWWVWPSFGFTSVFGFLLIILKKPFIIRTFFLRLSELFYGLLSGSVFISDTSWHARFWTHFARSAVLNFGWLSNEGPSWIYYIYGVFVAVSVLGWLFILSQRKKPGLMRDSLQGIVLAIGVLSILGASSIHFILKGAFSQGRYLYPAMPAFGILFTAGLSALIPKSLHRPVILFLVSVMWCINIWSLLHVLIGGFYF
jgi:hypothetical protein